MDAHTPYDQRLYSLDAGFENLAKLYSDPDKQTFVPTRIKCSGDRCGGNAGNDDCSTMMRLKFKASRYPTDRTACTNASVAVCTSEALAIALINALPIIAPFAYSHAASKLDLP
jgi:hypothetical protein